MVWEFDTKGDVQRSPVTGELPCYMNTWHATEAASSSQDQDYTKKLFARWGQMVDSPGPPSPSREVSVLASALADKNVSVF